MTAYALYHSSELDAANDDLRHCLDSCMPIVTHPSGWYVCPSIPEGAIIDHRMRGPFDTTAEALTIAARMELTEP